MQASNKTRRVRDLVAAVEALELRVLLSAAFDITGLTTLRNNPAFSNITGQGVGIAVLDTGVDAQNPDLSSNVVAFYNAVEDQPANASTAVADAVDNDGHGSHVSGIAASSNPAIGVAYGAKLIDIKVIADAGESQLGGDPLLRGLDWVAMNYQTYNIKVVNMSLGDPGVNDNTVTTADAKNAEAVEIKTLQNLGITVVSASGNSYANDPTAGESFPAVVSTIGVANTWDDAGQASDFGVPYGESGDTYYAIDNSATPDTLASTSQRSTLNNQLAAPGEDIYSTWNGTLDSSNGSDLLHNTISGTSMAAPFVSGVVALMQDAAEYFGGHYISDPNEILTILQQTSDTIVDSNNPNNARYDSTNGATSNLPETGLSFKRVDVLKAIEAVQQIVTGGAAITTTPQPGPDTDNATTTATPVNSIDGTNIDTFTGNIGDDGLVQVGVNDVDLYKLAVVSPGSLTVTLTQPTSGTAFAASLRLYDSSGNLVANVDGTAGKYPVLTTSATPLGIGTYYLGISSVGNENYTINGTGAAGGTSQGDYSVQIQLINPDPNGTIQGAVAVDLTNPDYSAQDPSTGLTYTYTDEQGELGSDPPPTGSSTRITVASDVDMFVVTATDNGKLDLDTYSDTSTGDQTFVEVFDSNMKVVGSAANTNRFTGDNPLSVPIVSGQTYYVAVTVPGNSGFNPTNPFLGRTAGATPSNQPYDLQLRFDNGDEDGIAFNANIVNVGTAVNANVGTDNGVTVGADGSQDVDWYTFTANSYGLFDVTAASGTANFTPDLSLWQYTQGGQDIVKVADTASANLFASPASLFSPSSITPPGGMGTGHLIYAVTAGETLFVAVTGQGNSNFDWYSLASGSGGQTGGYSLTTKLQPASNLSTLSDNSIENATPQSISVGQTINGDIGSDGVLVVGATDVDMFKLVAPATETLDIKTSTNQDGDADTVLRVFDASGNQLAENDNLNSSTTASEAQVSVQQGQTYYIGVDGAGSGALNYNPVTGVGAGVGSTGNYALTVSAEAPGFNVQAPAPVTAFGGSVVVFTVSLAQPLSAAATVDYATSDGTAAVGADYTAESGTLTFAPGVTVQTISVPVLVNAAADQGTRTFTLTLSNASGAAIVTATATATIDVVPVTTLTFGAGQIANYKDSAGKPVKLLLAGPGTGQAIFVNGAADPSEIALSDTTTASSFTIKGPGATIADVQATGSLYAITGAAVTLSGDLNVAGSLTKLSLGNVTGGASGGAISIGAGGAPSIITLGLVSNESLTTAGAIALLTVGDWLDSGGAPVPISAASVGNVTSKGDFAGSIAAASLGVVKVNGSLTSGTWNVSGDGADITVNGAVDPGWTATFGGDLNAVKLGSDSGDLSAGSVNSIKIAGALTNADITLTGGASTLGALTVGQAVTESQIVTAGNIGKVSVGSFLSSALFAGVSASVTGLPTAVGDFTADDSIVSFTVKANNKPYSFANSEIAAASIGTVSVARVNPDNGGVKFGVATESLAAFTNVGVLKWKSVETAATLAPDGDLIVSFL
ncbi:MAG TPA: S8 family serine peptidase [Tepidisphaeraceae bacterium]|jgi:hypothetical protein|nr:S8 family serine peptidase [Tepidisphaeraceae bacterium]